MRRWLTACAAGFLLLAMVLFALPATAHNKSISFSDWLWQGDGLSVSFTIGLRDATLLPDVATAASIDEALGAHLDARFMLQQNNQACRQAARFTRTPAQQGYLKMQARYVCFSHTAPLRFSNHGFFDIARTHVHFARFRVADAAADSQNAGGHEVLFTATQRQHQISLSASGQMTSETPLADVLGSYFALGVTHILTGIDHLAFVVCLMLLAATLKARLVLITGFTLGHSVTLALAALNIVTPNALLIEAIIGGSIALVAGEYILARTGAMPKAGFIAGLVLLLLGGYSLLTDGAIPLFGWVGLALFCACYGASIRTPQDAQHVAPLMTFGFGLFHGFGFAGLLSDIGLPQGQVLGGLLGFNLGVEFGQILFIVPVILIGHWVKDRLPKMPLKAGDIIACGLAGFGIFLFVQRAVL